jgi:tRNA(fMet)-specific endonuclease VapC
MLDTNIVSKLARNPKGTVLRRVAEVRPEAICVGIITAAELRYG